MENGTAVASALNGSTLMMGASNGDEEMNGLDLSTKGSNSSSGGAGGGLPILTPLHHPASSNGSSEGTPTPTTPLNGSPEKSLEAGQISPSSLRRSTRASAIKAQQKIKDGDVPQAMEQENSVESEDESIGDEKKESLEGESAAKKRKLENGKALDQFSHEFSIKMEEDGQVYMLDEGSELSSLNETEIETLKKCYDKLLARELTAEQKEERTRMIKQAEADLRNEEAKLTMLKKMRASQVPKPNPVSDLQRKLAANVAANSAGAAYKPPVAGTNAAAKNNALAGSAAALAQLFSGKGNPQAQAQLMALLQSQASSLMPNLTPQQKEVLQMMSRMGQYGTAQLMAAAALHQKSGQQLTKEQQQLLAAALLQQSKGQAGGAASTSSAVAASQAATAAAAANAASTATHNGNSSTPSASSSSTLNQTSASAAAAVAAAASSSATTAQKLQAARHAFRKTADGQLVTQTVMPKACPNELFFIPNPNAPDFLYMLGLDQVVGRVLKDKNATRSVSERPYECEECGSDFATGWKCIGAKEDDLHLYCEACLRQAQKKKLRHDRNAQLKKIYSKVAGQEKEFEKQISDGKLDGMLATVFAQLQGQNSAVSAAAARPTAAASPAVQNLSTKPSTPAVPSPAAMQKPATPMQSTPSSSKTTSSTANSSSTSSGTKRPAAATPNNSQQLQAQLAQLAQMARSNPMMAAALMSGMGGGLMGSSQAQQQAAATAAAAMSYAPMLQQMQQMQQLARMQQQASNNSAAAASAAKASSSSASSSAAASNSSSNNHAATVQANMAMTMLAQAMQNANRTNAAAGANGNMNAQLQAMAQLAALSQAGNQFANHPQLLRQMQQQLAAQMKNAGKK